MLKKNVLIVFALFFVLRAPAFGQTFNATVENQTVVGSTFYFDIVLQRAAAASDFYLGGCQFILAFNNAAFTNPAIALDPDDATYFALTNSPGSACGSWYYANTIADIAGNQIRISINTPSVSTLAQFTARIAKIDNNASTHRLGRYAITGIANATASAGLAWRVRADGNPYSKISVLENVLPFLASEPAGNWIQPEGKPLPVDISSFTATVEGKAVRLAWATSTEKNNAGFNVERKAEKGDWQNLGFVDGAGSSNAQHAYAYRDAKLRPGTYSYRLKQINRDGAFEYTRAMEAVVALAPEDYALSQNYPNPFNPSTSINFAVHNDQLARIIVFNMLGQEVATLFNEVARANTLNTVAFNASGLSSGVYFYRLQTAGRNEIKKMIIAK
jgi:hypothetical protein